MIAVKNGKASLINIKEGLISRDSTEVFGNFSAGDHIVTIGNDELKDADPVN